MEEKPKYKKPRCIHDKIKSQCKECGGRSICIHKRYKPTCVECAGSSICEHKRQKSVCKDCKGISLCCHERQKSVCKDCKGISICIHNIKKTQCRDCKGSSFCIHNKRKSDCIECDGTNICIHKRYKPTCIKCGGASICEHKRQKRYCKECRGTCICKHNKIKTQCSECKGKDICEHNKRKTQCRDCKGTSFCIHDKLKHRCKLCGGNALCKSEHCETRASKKYNGYCLPCCIQVCPDITVSRNYKTKENTVVDIIKEKFPNLTWIADKKIKDGCSNRRPDLLVDMGTHIIILEIDENKHSTYDCSCENKRLMLLSQDVGHRPIVFIRFNPDGYIDQEGNTVKSCWKLNQLGVMKIIKTKEKEWEERMNNLIQQIQYWIINPTEKTVEIVELYY
jgi:hypothetical protein